MNYCYVINQIIEKKSDKTVVIHSYCVMKICKQNLNRINKIAMMPNFEQVRKILLKIMNRNISIKQGT